MKKGTGKAALAEAENDFAVATMMREEDLAELFRKTLADINNKRRNRNRNPKKTVSLADLEPHLVPLALGMSQFVPELVAKLGTSAERLHMDYFRYRAFMSTLAQRAAYAVAQGRAARAYRDIDETLQKGGSEGRNRDGNGLGDGDGNARSVGMDAANLQLVIESLGFDDVSHREREDLEARSSTVSGGGAAHGRRGGLRRVNMSRVSFRNTSVAFGNNTRGGAPGLPHSDASEEDDDEEDDDNDDDDDDASKEDDGGEEEEEEEEEEAVGGGSDAGSLSLDRGTTSSESLHYSSDEFDREPAQGHDATASFDNGLWGDVRETNEDAGGSGMDDEPGDATGGGGDDDDSSHGGYSSDGNAGVREADVIEAYFRSLGRETAVVPQGDDESDLSEEYSLEEDPENSVDESNGLNGTSSAVIFDDSAGGNENDDADDESGGDYSSDGYSSDGADYEGGDHQEPSLQFTSGGYNAESAPATFSGQQIDDEVGASERDEDSDEEYSLDGFSAEGEDDDDDDNDDDDDDDDGDASQDKATTASENFHDISETTSLSPKLPESSTAALPPPAYVCPITQELMNDPVTTLDGHTFERAAIEHWFETNDASPRTGKLLRNKLLIPNIALREQIEIFRIEHGYPPIQPPYHPSSEELAEGAQDGDGGEANGTGDDRASGEADVEIEDDTDDTDDTDENSGDDDDDDDDDDIDKNDDGDDEGEDDVGVLSTHDESGGDSANFDIEHFLAAHHVLAQLKKREELNRIRVRRTQQIQRAYALNASHCALEDGANVMALDDAGFRAACARLNMTWDYDVLDDVASGRKEVPAVTKLLRALLSPSFYLLVLILIGLEACGQMNLPMTLLLASFLVLEFVVRSGCYGVLGTHSLKFFFAEKSNGFDFFATVSDGIFVGLVLFGGSDARLLEYTLSERFEDTLSFGLVPSSFGMLTMFARIFRMLRVAPLLIAIFKLVVVYPALKALRLFFLIVKRLHRWYYNIKDEDDDIEGGDLKSRDVVCKTYGTFRRYISVMHQKESTIVWPFSEYLAAFASAPTFDGSTIHINDLPALLSGLGCTGDTLLEVEDIVKNDVDRSTIFFDDLVNGMILFRDNTDETNFYRGLEARRHRAFRAFEKVSARFCVCIATLVGEFVKSLAGLVVNLYILAQGYFGEELLAAKTAGSIGQFSTALSDAGPVGKLIPPAMLTFASWVRLAAEMVTVDISYEGGVTCSGVNALFVLPILFFVTGSKFCQKMLANLLCDYLHIFCLLLYGLIDAFCHPS